MEINPSSQESVSGARESLSGREQTFDYTGNRRFQKLIKLVPEEFCDSADQREAMEWPSCDLMQMKLGNR